MANAVMIQGAGSNVGKSMLVAGLARALTRRGLSVAPFKPQNMSNNAAVTCDGGEIGRAQALQARAALREPHSDMNPVLLKPESEHGAQVIVQGRVAGRLGAHRFGEQAANLMPKVLESFARLRESADIVLVEGAGSPAEINLRKGDIANMGFARAAGVPVVLVGDIDRGGVIAQLVGTQAVLDPADAAMIKGFAVNKFRGSLSLFDGGREEIAKRTGWPDFGTIPWFDDAWRLPAEDMLDLAARPGGACRIVVPRLPRMANFDDLDPLAAEPEVTLDIIDPGHALPGNADLILLPGSKATIDDLEFLRAQGWDIDVAAHARRGGEVVGLCGGYQMLGQTISDPDGIEGPPRCVPGLGLLDVETVLRRSKRLALSEAVTAAGGLRVSGYEIHMGETDGPDRVHPWFEVDGVPEGAVSHNGQVRGSYLHGVFGADAFRQDFLGRLGHAATLNHTQSVEDTLDALAAHLERYMDVDALIRLAGR